MKDIFSKRLKSARAMAKLTQEELGQMVNITKNAISKYEKGEMLADPGVLQLLARALQVSPDYLIRPFEVELTKVEFRKKTKLSSRDEQAIEQQILNMVENYLKTEEILNISFTFNHPFPGTIIRGKADMELYAAKLTDKWKLGMNGIPSVFRILEDNEIKVIEFSASDNFDGWSAYANDKYPVIVLNAAITPERKRFTALHELAHLLFDFDEKLSDREVEKLCHYFAGAIMLPEQLMYSLLGRYRSKISFEERKNINRVYGISHQAFMYRALELGIIKPYYYSQFQFSIRNNRKEVGLSVFGGEEKATRFISLIWRALSEDLVTIGKASELSGISVEKLAEAIN